MAKTTTTNAAETKQVTANVPVLYDGTPVAVNETFAVRTADLAQLLEVGAVSLNTDPA